MSYFRKHIDIFEQSTPISIFGRRSKKRKIRFDIDFTSSEYSILLLPRYSAQCVKQVIKNQSIFPKPTLLTCHLGRAGLNAIEYAILPVIST